MTPRPTVQLETLVKRREKYFARLQALYDVGKKCIQLAQQKQSYTAELDSFVSRFQRIEDDYEAFEQVSDEINIANTQVEEGEKIDVTKASLAYDEIYFNVKTIARKMNVGNLNTQSKPETTQSSVPTQSSQVARLPKLEIEPFDESITAWPNFYALYTSMIHKNACLTKVEKLTYLRSLLKSHALSLIDTLAISEDNYDIAMQILIERYQNKRLLASSYLDKILSFRQMTEDSTNSFSNFMEVFNSNLSAVKVLDIDDLFDFTMLHIGLRSLTPSTRKDFESHHSSNDIPKFEDLIKFVQQQLKILEITNDPKGKSKPHKPTQFSKPSSSRSAMLSTVNTIHYDKGKNASLTCPCCQDISHKIYGCSKFKGMSVAQRYDQAKKSALCFSCLGSHMISDCKSKSKCFKCSGKHHTLLHRSDNSQVTESKPNAGNNVEPKTCHYTNTCSSTNMLLSTAIIGIRDNDGELKQVRAIIDGGSQTSLITTECVERLGLKRRYSKITLMAVANTSVSQNKGSVMCSISPISTPETELTTEAIVVPKISSDQPNIQLDRSVQSKFSNLKLADPTFDQSAPIDFLLGSDLYYDIILDSHNIIKGQPSALATIFGWIIGGKVPSISSTNENSYFLTCCESVDKSIKRFWETESVNTKKPINPEDIETENHFQTTHFRDETNRYVVSLPVRSDNISLPNTREIAKHRLINLESRLKKTPTMYQEYRDFLNDYIAQGHMSIATTPSTYIIPHHCVRKEDSSTTKLRVVFNASFKPKNDDKSLNDNLFPGPKLQKDITEIITNFRLHSIVVCSDIKQMYRQIVVAPEQRSLQHIFYRTLPNGPIEEYELNVPTYGVTSSAFLAQRVLLQLVKDFSF
ncbi:uncharacterized protein LOC129003568 [Macrosteles quadrilineatus]|uniref:uncharacterized protein LOC129003568 n=1 Tax=Macrosteles quadrilineatus TaxID=74068 RepID=UPI0023E14FCC|nr:uncharacterized protein LOC129003568 [Macrosteles quadrilineatus]